MSYDDFIISVYLLADVLYKNIVTKPIRSKGYAPVLSDVEVITMELVGESLGFDTDKGIWAYFKNCYQHYFPKLGSYPNFAKHCANLFCVKDKMMSVFNEQHQHNQAPYLIDSFPIPVCRYGRARRHQSFKQNATYGYCASQDMKYFGFKGHLLTNAQGQIIWFGV